MPSVNNTIKFGLAAKNLMKNILYKLMVLSFCVLVNAKDLRPIELEAYSGDSSILLIWEIPEKINIKSIKLFRTQNSFSNYSLIYETNNSNERFLDIEVDGKRPYFYNIEIESVNGDIFSNVMDAPPFAKAYIDNNLLPLLSLEENKLVKNKYKDIETFHDQVLSYILLDILISADSSQLEILQRMIQYKDDLFISWMGNAGFKSLKTYKDYLTDENINNIYEQLEDILKKVGIFYYNQFLLTPSEWNNHSSLFSNYIYNRLFSIRKMLISEIKMLDDAPPILPLGTWQNIAGSSIARFAVIHAEKIQSIMLRDNYNEIKIEESIYKESQIFDIVLMDNMEKYELIINGSIQKILPITIDDYGYGITIEDQYFMLNDTISEPPLVVSEPMGQFCLNEIVNVPETNQIFIEIHGSSIINNNMGLFINDILVWDIDPIYSYEPVYTDSVFVLNDDLLFLWIDLKLKDDFGQWQLIDTRAIFSEKEITEGRIPDHHGWKQYSISTLGEPNDLVKSATSQLMIPEIFALYQNYPNPFNSETTISFDLLQPAIVSLYVNDAAGRIIHLFFEENQMNKGLYSYSWSGEKFSSGLYFMTIQAQVEDYLPIIYSRKMIYLK